MFINTNWIKVIFYKIHKLIKKKQLNWFIVIKHIFILEFVNIVLKIFLYKNLLKTQKRNQKINRILSMLHKLLKYLS